MMDSKLLYNKPDLKDTRGNTHLLVFGDLGVWLVVDDELLALMERFDGNTDLDAVLEKHASRWAKPREAVNAEALPLVESLVVRGVLYKHGHIDPPIEEPLSIANVTLNLTNRCNLHCPFCYNGARAGEEVPVDDLVDFLRAGRTAFSRDASLIILGGEPLIRANRLFQLVEKAGDLFAKPPMISTNGTLLDKEIVSRLSATRVEVQVSIDSANAEIHNRGRGKGVHEKAIAGIRRLVDAGVYTIVSMVFKQSTIGEMAGFLSLASELKVNEARFIPLRNAGAAANADANRRELPNLVAAFETLLGILENTPEYIKLLARDFFSIAAAQCHYSSSRVNCGIGRRVIFIDADGTLYPCPNHVKDAFRLGHVRTDSLEKTLLYSDAMQRIRDNYRVSRYPQCVKCPFKRWCAGDCRGEVLATTDNPYAPSPHCDELKQMYTVILWRLAEGDSRVSGISAGMSVEDAKNRFLV
jgi:radical SAM protein with 4Fe4S-binding SPASM domain